MTRPPDCGAPPPDANDPAFLAATQWLIGTAADVNELIDAARGMLEREVSNGSTSMMPQLLVRVRTEPDQPAGLMCYALAVDFNTSDEKRALLRQLGRDLYSEQKFPIAICLLSEAWTSSQAPDGPRVEPRLDPNRREILMAMAASNAAWNGSEEKLTRMLRLPVRRGEGERFVADGPIYDSAADAELRNLQSPLLRVFFQGFIETPLRKAGLREGGQ